MGSDVKKARKVLTKLGDLLRAMLDQNDKYIQSVEEELEEIRRRNLDGELYPTEAPIDDELVPALRQGPAFEPEHSPLDARVGLALMNRNFSYRDDLGGTTRPYTLPMGAALGFGAAWYPGAHFSNGALAHVGLTFDASHSLGMSTQGPNEVSYPTKDSRWGIGARGRLPIGDSEVGVPEHEVPQLPQVTFRRRSASHPFESLLSQSSQLGELQV